MSSSSLNNELVAHTGLVWNRALVAEIQTLYKHQSPELCESVSSEFEQFE